MNGEGQVKLIKCPLIKLKFYSGKKRKNKKYIKYEIYKREEKGKYAKKYKAYEGRGGDDRNAVENHQANYVVQTCSMKFP